MTANYGNRKQVFADLVSIEAWHEEFTEEKPSQPLFASIVFGEAKLGGGADSKVTFRLRVKRAEVVVIINDSEPARIDPREVARFINESKVQRTISYETAHSGNVDASLTSSLGLKKGPSLDVSVSAEGKANSKRQEKTERREEVSLFEITQSKDNNQNYRWIIEHLEKKTLEGSPWIPNETPLVTIIDKRRRDFDLIPPSIQLAVRCYREDLEISDIQVKEPNKVKGWGITKSVNTINKINIRAAEAVILNSLTENGLETRDLSESFSQIILGTILAEALPYKES